MTPRRQADQAQPDRVQAAALPAGQLRPGGQQGADPRPRLALRLRRRRPDRRVLHLDAAPQGRHGRPAADPHAARLRLLAAAATGSESAPKRWSLRARLLAGVLTLVAPASSCADIASVLAAAAMYLIERIDEQLYVAMHDLINAPLTRCQVEVEQCPSASARRSSTATSCELRDPQRHARIQRRRRRARAGLAETADARPGDGQKAGGQTVLTSATPSEYHDAGLPGARQRTRRTAKASLVIAYDFTGDRPDHGPVRASSSWP